MRLRHIYAMEEKENYLVASLIQSGTRFSMCIFTDVYFYLVNSNLIFTILSQDE